MTATTLFSLSSGRIVSAAGRHLQTAGGFNRNTLTPGTGATLLPVFQEIKRHHDMREPRPEDDLSEDDYEAAIEAYENALYWAEERAIEEYYENKNKSKR
jgi:hypothetical protein